MPNTPNKMTKSYAFTKESAERIFKAVRQVERQGISLGGQSPTRAIVDRPVVFAKLTCQSGGYYAWSEARPTDTGWELVGGGLSGTTTQRPAILLDTMPSGHEGDVIN